MSIHRVGISHLSDSSSNRYYRVHHDIFNYATNKWQEGMPYSIKSNLLGLYLQYLHDFYGTMDVKQEDSFMWEI